MGSVGDNDSDDTHLHSFYMVELTYSPHTLQENIFIYGKIIHFGEFYTYLISDISHLIWYVNTIYYKTKIIISLKNVIQSDITKIKLRYISELPPFTKTIKEELLLWWNPFELSIHNHELISYEKKEERIFNRGFSNRDILQIIGDDNQNYW